MKATCHDMHVSSCVSSVTSITLVQGPWTEEEDQLIILAQKIHGNRFAEIAKMVHFESAPACPEVL